jgi:hypothetical protein
MKGFTLATCMFALQNITSPSWLFGPTLADPVEIVRVAIQKLVLTGCLVHAFFFPKKLTCTDPV